MGRTLGDVDESAHTSKCSPMAIYVPTAITGLPNMDLAELGASFKSDTQLKSGIETFTLGTTKISYASNRGMSRPACCRPKELD